MPQAQAIFDTYTHISVNMVTISILLLSYDLLSVFNDHTLFVKIGSHTLSLLLDV